MSLKPRIFDVRQVPSDKSATLLSTGGLQIDQVRLRAGEQKPVYAATGEALIYCVEGWAEVCLAQGKHELGAATLLVLDEGEPHALRAIQDCLLLVVNASRKSPRQHVVDRGSLEQVEPPSDAVQEASEESFPASDPPSWTPMTSP